MAGRAAETAAVAAIAGALTLVLAAPVLRAPSERLFGRPIVGHHHDPFTAMRRFAGPLPRDEYLQPVTDVPGALVARAVGPVAAFNVIVLITFPLAAAGAYLLARHFSIARSWAALAALAFAFSPFHVAHAAYHPHIAQTQWIPLYLVALWRCLDAVTPARVALLAAASAAVALSNFYGGLIAAVITIPAAAAYVVFQRGPRPAAAAGTLVAIGAAGAAYVAYAAAPVIAAVSSYAADPVDLVRYGARVSSYVLPSVAHPLAGAAVSRVWHDAGVDVGLLEQQVSIGIGVLLLAGVASAARAARARLPSGRALVPVALVVALVAFVCSLAPGAGGGWQDMRPATALHQVAPMFRAYARFGVVVQLMAVLLAAAGAEHLWRAGSATARAACVALIALAAAEYAVWPPLMWRDTLPTAAHRWAANAPAHVAALDCADAGADADAVRWLTRGRVLPYRAPFTDCTAPAMAETLAAAGFTHLIVRHDSDEGRWFRRQRRVYGLQAAQHLADSDVYAIGAPVPIGQTVVPVAERAR